MVNLVVPEMQVVLPHYLRAHWSQTSEEYTYRWEVNGRIKDAGFQPVSVKFGTDLERAIRIVNHELLPKLEAFLKRKNAVAVPTGPVEGTIDGLFEWYMKQEEFTSLRIRTQRRYRVSLTTVANHVFRKEALEGRRFGALLVEEVNLPVARQLISEYATVVCGQTDDGKPIERKRDGGANHARATLVTVWNNSFELYPGVPLANVWSRTKKRKYRKRKTVHATIEDLAHFIMSARENGYPNLGVAAWFAFEFEMRVESTLNGGLLVEHYKPAEYPTSVKITHYKTGEEYWVALRDTQGESLYPGLEAALDELKGTRTSGVLIPKDGTLKAWAKPEEPLGLFYRFFNRIAGSRLKNKGITFTSFRHGGITEGAEAGLTEFEIMVLSGHKDPRTVQAYVKRTATLFESAQKKRLAHRARVIESLIRGGVINGEMLAIDGIQDVIERLPPVPKVPEAPEDSIEA